MGANSPWGETSRHPREYWPGVKAVLTEDSEVHIKNERGRKFSSAAPAN